jgi:uncharacterized membrane protein
MQQIMSFNVTRYVRNSQYRTLCHKIINTAHNVIKCCKLCHQIGNATGYVMKQQDLQVNVHKIVNYVVCVIKK